MFHYETITSDCKKLLNKLSTLDELKSFRLVGGTSLSLQLGHRISKDLDFFTDKTFDATALELALHRHFPDTQIVTVRSTGFSALVNQIKCDFYNWSVPFIRPIVLDGSIRLAHIEEIAPMKLDTIFRRQERKDLIDIFVLLKQYSLADLLNIYREKYPFQDWKPVLEFLRMPDLADETLMPETLINESWEEMKDYIVEAVSSFFEERKKASELKREERLAKARQLLENRPPIDETS